MKRKNKQEYNDKNTDTTVSDLVNTFENATGLQFVQEGIKWVSIGSFMGMSDAIPGYSGGTSLAIMGVFKRLILIAKSLFIPEKGISRIKAFLFMLPFGMGWLAGIYGFAKLTSMMASHHMGMELIIFFSTFMMFAIPVFLIAENPQLWSKGKKIRIKKTRRWWFFLLGMCIVVGLTIWTLVRGGVSFDGDENKRAVYELSNLGWLKLVGVAYLAGIVTIIPGGSGAIVQLLTGMYQNIHWEILANVTDNWASLFIFATSTFLGIMTTTFIMAWGLKKHGRELAAFSFGMLVASIVGIYFIPKPDIWANASNWKHIIGIIVSFSLAVLFAFIIWSKVTNKKWLQRKSKHKKSQ